ncbi:MAG: hypothetical protein QOJ78_2536, partial [Pseudonocardiales bacterium]|nr:hypothetical protein [Pseudonocardiales bacterium]
GRNAGETAADHDRWRVSHGCDHRG